MSENRTCWQFIWYTDGEDYILSLSPYSKDGKDGPYKLVRVYGDSIKEIGSAHTVQELEELLKKEGVEGVSFPPIFSRQILTEEEVILTEEEVDLLLNDEGLSEEEHLKKFDEYFLRKSR